MPKSRASAHQAGVLAFQQASCADVSKADVPPLGSPSFSLDHLKEKHLAEEFGVAMMYENVAPHAWSPPNFPHTEKEAKVMYAPRNGTLNGQAL